MLPKSKFCFMDNVVTVYYRDHSGKDQEYHPAVDYHLFVHCKWLELYLEVCSILSRLGCPIQLLQRLLKLKRLERMTLK